MQPPVRRRTNPSGVPTCGRLPQLHVARQDGPQGRGYSDFHVKSLIRLRTKTKYNALTGTTKSKTEATRFTASPSDNLLLLGQPAEQQGTQDDKENIGKPDQQLRMDMRIAAQRIADDDKEKISGGNNQTHGEPD